MSAPTSAGYRFGPDFSVHWDGVELCCYAADRLSGTTLRGLPAQMTRQLWEHHASGHPITDDLADRGQLGVPSHRWRQLTAELTARGILVPLAGQQPSSPLADPVTRVRIVTPDDLRDDVLRSLSGCGVPVGATASVATERELVVLVDDRYDVALHRELNRAALLSGTAFVSMRLGHRSVELGPLTLPGGTACFECYWQRLQAPFLDGEPAGWVADSVPHGCFREPGWAGDRVAYIALGLLAVEVGHILHGPAPVTMSAVTTLDVDTFQTRRRRVVEVPGCGACAVAREIG